MRSGLIRRFFTDGIGIASSASDTLRFQFVVGFEVGIRWDDIPHFGRRSGLGLGGHFGWWRRFGLCLSLVTIGRRRRGR